MAYHLGHVHPQKYVKGAKINVGKSVEVNKLNSLVPLS